MENLSEYADADNKKPLIAELDPSDPLEFLDKAFDFLATETDVFERDSVDGYGDAVLRTMKSMVKTELERKRKGAKIEGDGTAEKNIEEEVLPPPPPVKNEDTKEVEEKKEEPRVWISDPLEFLDMTFDFLATETDVFERYSVDGYGDTVLRTMKSMVKTELERKRKGAKIEGDSTAEKNIKEEVLPPPVKNEDTKELEVKKEELRAPNKCNGLDMDNYSWGQTSKYVIITIPVPPKTLTRDITCEIGTLRIKFGLEGQPPVLDGELCKPINFIDSFWGLDDKSPVSICLAKQDTIQEDWWKYIVKGEPEIDTKKVIPDETNFLKADTEARPARLKMAREERMKKYREQRRRG